VKKKGKTREKREKNNRRKVRGNLKESAEKAGGTQG
jgi:hypothetical protein